MTPTEIKAIAYDEIMRYLDEARGVEQDEEIVLNLDYIDYVVSETISGQEREGSKQ